MESETERAIESVWRIESARLIAGLTRYVRDVGLAEDLAQDALVAALEQWPQSGVPDNPGAWLMATAKHRAIDLFRRNKRLAQKHELLARELATQQEGTGMDAGTEATGSGDDLLNLIFNEGYAATSGGDWIRPALCEEALRLGRVLAGLTPDQAEVHGLVALMELQASRLRARTGPHGEPVLLLDQNRGRWDQLLIRRGLAALARAEAVSPARGPYALQAAIAACHARARAAAETDWRQIAALYDELARAMPSPVVELNRAVAHGMAFGPAAGLARVDALRDDPALQRYHLLPSVRGDLLAKLGRADEARREFERAAALTRNERERSLLLGRAAACTDEAP